MPTPEDTLAARNHNENQIISRLPSKILAKIFELHQGKYEFQPLVPLPYTKTTHKDIFPFLYICHSWHVLAIGHPPLWQRIDFRLHSTRICEEMVSRSGDLSVDVIINPFHAYFYNTTHAMSRILSIIVSLAPRLRDVWCSLSPSRCGELLLKLGESHSVSSPIIMRKLSMKSTEISSLAGRLPDVEWARFTLQTLDLNSLPFPWNPKLAFARSESLTTLRLKNVPHRPRISISQFIAIFENFPSLSHFYFRPAYSLRDPKASLTLYPSKLRASEGEAASPITMNYLQFFQVDNIEIESLIAISNRLVLPQKDVHWAISTVWAGGYPLNDLIRLLNHLFSGLFSFTTTFHEAEIVDAADEKIKMMLLKDDSSNGIGSIWSSWDRDEDRMLPFPYFTIMLPNDPNVVLTNDDPRLLLSFSVGPRLQRFCYNCYATNNFPQKVPRAVYEPHDITLDDTLIRCWRSVLTYQQDLTALVTISRHIPSLAHVYTTSADPTQPSSVVILTPNLHILQIEVIGLAAGDISRLLLILFKERKKHRADFRLSLDLRLCPDRATLLKTLREAGAGEVVVVSELTLVGGQKMLAMVDYV